MKKIEDKHVRITTFSIYIDGKEAATTLEWIEALFHNAKKMGIAEQNLVSTISENLPSSEAHKLSECYNITTNGSYTNKEKELKLGKVDTRSIFFAIKKSDKKYLG